MPKCTLGAPKWTLGAPKWTLGAPKCTLGVPKWTLGAPECTLGVPKWTLGGAQVDLGDKWPPNSEQMWLKSAACAQDLASRNSSPDPPDPAEMALGPLLITVPFAPGARMT